MPTPVVMPQMGESIAEGTIVRWIKKVGDAVDRDEPLFEISTDKVDAEIPVAGGGRPDRDQGARRRDRRRQQRRRRRLAQSVARSPSARTRAPEPQRPPNRRAMQSCRPTAIDPSAREGCRSQPAAERPVGCCRQAAPRTICGGRGRRRSSAASPASTTSTSRRFTAPGSAAASRRTTFSSTSTPGLRNRRRSQGVDGATRPGSPPEPEVRPHARRDQAALGDAQEDRRAHGPEPPHVGARALGLPRELLDRRADPPAEEGRVRAARGAKLTYMAFIAKAVVRRAAPHSRSSTPRSTATTSSTRRTSTSGSPSRSRAA